MILGISSLTDLGTVLFVLGLVFGGLGAIMSVRAGNLRQALKDAREEAKWYREKASRLQSELDELRGVVKRQSQEIDHLRTLMMSPEALANTVQRVSESMTKTVTAALAQTADLSIQSVITAIKTDLDSIVRIYLVPMITGKAREAWSEPGPEGA